MLVNVYVFFFFFFFLGGGGGRHSERVDGEIEEKTHTHNVKTINKHLDKKRERYFIDLKGSICKVINKDWLSNIKPRASHIRRRTLPEVDSSLSDLIQETFPVVLNNNIHRRVSQSMRLFFLFSFYQKHDTCCEGLGLHF